MRNFLSVLTLLSLIASLYGCPAYTTFKLRTADNEKTIEMGPLDKLEIVLDANPTTGYQWKALPWDTKVIEKMGKPVYVSQSNAIGSGGQTTFRFRALASGRTSLKFIYFRVFEKDVPPVKSFTVKVVVSEH